MQGKGVWGFLDMDNLRASRPSPDISVPLCPLSLEPYIHDMDNLSVLCR